VVVGDLVEDFAIAAITKLFGDWPIAAKSTGDRPAVTVPDPLAPPARQLVAMPMMNKSQADVVYGFVGVRRSDPDFTAMSVMNNALGQYAIGGKLGDSIRERQGMAYYVYSTLDSSLAEGPMMIRAGVSTDNVERTLSSIDAELDAVLRDGITAKEFDESKRYLIGSIPRQLETNAAIAGFLLSTEFYALGADYDARLPALIADVTLDQVNTVAHRLIHPKRAVIVIAGPWSGPNTGEAIILSPSESAVQPACPERAQANRKAISQSKDLP
jgi:zinc protease